MGSGTEHFSKDDIHKANRDMERCLASPIIREMPIRSTGRHHLTSVRTAVMMKAISPGEDVRKRDPVCCWWECGSG